MATTIENDAVSLDDFEGDDASGVTYFAPDLTHDARGYTLLLSPFGPMYHFGTTSLSFKSVPDMGKDK
jgi:hypothetical protein